VTKLALSEISSKLREAAALHQRGLLAPAEAIYLEILDRQPDHFDALHLCGVIAAQTKNPERAVNLISKAIEIDPGIAPAHSNLAGALQQLHRLDEALASYNRAISIKPDYAEAYFNRANVLKDLQRIDAALESYDRATALRADFAPAHLMRGLALHERGMLEPALASYDAAIAIDPRHSLAYCNRGIVLRDLRRYEAALASFAAALAIDPRYSEAYCGRGAVLFELGHLNAALSSYESAIAINPDYADAHNNRGLTFLALKQIDTALDSLNRAIAIDENHANAHFNKAYALLLRGDLAAGWREHEWRWKSRSCSSFAERREFSSPLWRGEEYLVGKTLLLHSEQGLGDTLQFCRYAKMAARSGARIILEVQPPLAKLLAGLDGISQVVARGSPLPHFDYQCPLMSLPLVFGTTLETIPHKSAYLKSDPALSAKWRTRLRPDGLPLIGLAWSGRATNRNDRNRSIALGELLDYLPSEYRYVVLQKDVRSGDAITLRSNPRIIHPDDELDFYNTAAICECTDLVISVDTSLAHLSGALGKRTWILLPFSPDWRWLTDRTDSPWYSSVTLYRQPRLGDWKSVMEQLRADLIGSFQET